MNKSFLFLCLGLLVAGYTFSQDFSKKSVRTRLLTRPEIIPQSLLELRTVTVPDLSGRDAESQGLFSGIKESGLLPGIIVEVPDSLRPGKVIGQEPPAGFPVFSGTKINVLVSVARMPAGVPLVKIPGVTGFSVFQARQILSAMHLKTGEVTEIPDNQIQKLVIRQFPPEGILTANTHPVTLYISSGQPAGQLLAPDLVGKTLATISDLLRRNNLITGELKEVFSEESEGVIIAQSPQPGTPVSRNSTVDLTYTVRRYVPDLTGRSFDDAVTVLKAAGIPMGKIKDRKSDRIQGTILDQSLKPGTPVPPGKEIILTRAVIKAHRDLPVWIWLTAGFLLTIFLASFFRRYFR